jgi:hypothetical protein
LLSAHLVIEFEWNCNFVVILIRLSRRLRRVIVRVGEGFTTSGESKKNLRSIKLKTSGKFFKIQFFA